jgi:16S rRNA (adenine1518-N6/adenine1519-N6)-dimethyltransferase
LAEDGLPPLRQVIAEHGLSARKGLGQNFLRDLNLTRRIARAATAYEPGPLSEGAIIEIGPGPGGLTRALLMEGAEKLIAIEKDPRCLAALAQVQEAYPGKLDVISGDALQTSIASLGAPPRRIVANLPYNIATPLLIGWLREIDRDPACLSALLLLFQKEVVQRLTAAPKTKDYGRLSILTQWLCDAKMLFDIPPRAFTPVPKVTSTLIALEPRNHALAPARMEAIEQVTRAAFGQRRKMLRQSLKSLGVPAAELLEAARLSGQARAEDLSVAGFCALARAYDSLSDN